MLERATARITMTTQEVKLLLEAAVQDFQQRHPNFTRNIETRSDDVKNEILSLQERQDKQKSMQDLSRYKRVVEAFEGFENAANLSPQHAAFIWCPFGKVLQTALEDKTIFDSLLNAYYDLGSEIPNVEASSALLQTQPEMHKPLAFMYDDILKFNADILTPISTGQGWKRAFRANWTDYINHAFPLLLKRFSQHKDLFNRHVEMYKNVRLDDIATRVNEHVQDYREDRERLHEHMNESSTHFQEIRNQLCNSQEQQSRVQAQLGGISDLSTRINSLSQNYDEDREELLASIRTYEEDRKILLADAKAAEKKRKEDLLKQILKWLSTPNVDKEQDEHHITYQKSRVKAKSTCHWALKDDKILNWLNVEALPRHSTMWINGKMGAGKSVLASFIINQCMGIADGDLERHGTSSHEAADSGQVDPPSFDEPNEQPNTAKSLNFKTSYFYCREDGAGQNDSLTIFKSLLGQMLRHHQELLPVCHEKKAKGKASLNDEATAQILLELFAEAELRQFIVIDGIDSCSYDTRRVVVNFLGKLVDKCDEYEPGKLRVLFVSRNMEDIRKLKHIDGSTTIVEMTHKIVQEDIDRYLESNVPRMRQLGLDESQSQEIRDKILSRSDGLFLYASLVLRSLIGEDGGNDSFQGQPTVRDILAELKDSHFPKTLADVYDRMVTKLKRQRDGKGWEQSERIFGWLACSKRPLLWHEIQAVLVMDQDRVTGRLTMNYQTNKAVHTVHEVCGSLVQVMRSRITFVHSTAREHIIRGSDLDEKGIECSLAVISLTYLSADCFQKDKVKEAKDLDKFLDDRFYSFQDYAASKWNYHLEAVRQHAALILENTHRGAVHQRKLNMAVNAFIKAYETSLQPQKPSGSKKKNAPDHQKQEQEAREQAEKACEVFSAYPFHSNMVKIWTHLYHHSATADTKQRNKVTLNDLEATLGKVRSRMEAKWNGFDRDSEAEKVFLETYGYNVFKCDRTACDHFYQGFETAELRDAHINRHERPFMCPVEGCTLVKFGFSTNKDCEKHVRSYHPDDLASTNFGAVPRELMAASADKAKYNCQHCGKNFTRKAIREDHVLAHFGERPHECTLCVKKFTRAWDLRRHVLKVHASGRGRTR